MISIIDYTVGNIFSIRNALRYLGLETEVISKAKQVKEAKALLLPGVGAFDDAITGLENAGIVLELKAAIAKGTPTLGICLGMQVLAKQSEEGKKFGLGIIDTDVKKLSKERIIPHMGWNKVEYNNQLTDYYFVHSYYLPLINTTVGECCYGENFSAIIKQDNVLAVQFHPEKSGKNGLRLLQAFGEMI